MVRRRPGAACRRDRVSEAMDEEELLAEARRAMHGAHAPYSGFSVGAVLEAADGRRYAGCNVENASYPVSLCAERVALGAAVADGARRFRRIAMAVSGEDPSAPCGTCRQALREFGAGLEVVSTGSGGSVRRWRLADLLPDAFDGDDLPAKSRGGECAEGADRWPGPGEGPGEPDRRA